MHFDIGAFISVIISLASSFDYYNVAVIEYALNNNFSKPSKDILEENTRNYLDLIKNITENQLVDLVIFPESTLTPSLVPEVATLVPNSSHVVLCNSSDEKYQKYLKELSCAAMHYNTTIVINLTEREYEDTYYNTDVALAPNGTAIGRYRKWNLFGERGISKPPTLDVSIIELKNTKFGIMTCFDIQFGAPSFNLTKSRGVKHVIFPLRWISELPYLTALQVQQMWAQEMNVVLLASGASSPSSGAGGSGIFFGNHGPLRSDILPQKGTKVMIQSVPLDVEQPLDVSPSEEGAVDDLARSLDGFFMLMDPSLKDHNAVIVNTREETINSTVCHGEGGNVLCCDFSISLSFNGTTLTASSDSYTYQMVAFNGVRTYSGLYYGGVETCGVIACLNSSVQSCGQRFDNYSNIAWPLTFTSIKVRGYFTKSDQRVQYPTTLLASMRPLQIRNYSWIRNEVDSMVMRSISLEATQNRLLTFGIFGRDFERDWDPIRSSCSKGQIWFGLIDGLVSVLVLVYLVH